MSSLNDYRKMLSAKGGTLADIRKEQSDLNINISFAVDPHEYKKVLILTREGWKWEEVHFHRHNKQSISSDDQDYYIQFRPKVHYPVGSYIIIPDDTSAQLNLSEEELENPFLQPIEQRTQWWMIVDRNNNHYVQYNILKCNWNFEWIKDGKIWSVFGCNRDASSYTSGSWKGERTIVLDNVTNFWVPDTFQVYGRQLTNLGLCDTRYIDLNMRFILSYNQLNPKVFKASKVSDTTPPGIIKVTLEQDEFNERKDNPILRIADYYDLEGHCRLDFDYENAPATPVTSTIYKMTVSSDNELIEDGVIEGADTLRIGKASYYKGQFSEGFIPAKWAVTLINDGEYTEKDCTYYQNLIKLTSYEDGVISVKPGKANSLIGKKFTLTVSDENGSSNCSLVLEVIANE